MTGRDAHRALQPDGWPRPSGYANGIAATGTQVFVAGQIGWDADRRMARGDFVAQARQALLVSLRLEPDNPVAQHRLAVLDGEAAPEPATKKRGWKLFGRKD